MGGHCQSADGIGRRTLAGNGAIEGLIQAKIREGLFRQNLAYGILNHPTRASSGAWHILVQTPAGVPGSAFAAAASAKRVSLLPGKLFRADNKDENII